MPPAPNIRRAGPGVRIVSLALFSKEPFPFTEAELEDFRAAFPAHAAKARRVDGRMLGW